MSKEQAQSGDQVHITNEQRERLREIWIRSRDALQQVVTDLKITQDELNFAGRYFNRLGKSDMFPSLLAVGLAMTSLRATEGNDGGTPPNLEGPFHTKNAPERTDGQLWEKQPGPDARFLTLTGTVRDVQSGEPLKGVELDFWQADENGGYDNTGFNLRGRIFSDDTGQYTLKTIVPKDYAEHDHDPIGEFFRALEQHNRRAAHIHLKVNKPGYIPFTTQLYMPDGAYLHDDYVEGAVLPELTLNFDKISKDGRNISAKFDLAITSATT